MRMHNADFKGMPKILEINAKHPLISKLNDKLVSGDFADAADFAELIYQSALINDGKQLEIQVLCRKISQSHAKSFVKNTVLRRASLIINVLEY